MLTTLINHLSTESPPYLSEALHYALYLNLGWNSLLFEAFNVTNETKVRSQSNIRRFKE